MRPRCFHVEAGQPCTRYLVGADAERAAIAAYLRKWADEAKKIPGPPQYEDALLDAADHIERGEHLKP